MAGLNHYKKENIIVETSADGIVRKTIRAWFSGSPCDWFPGSSRKRLIIPLFQRRYLWGEDQCRRLFEDGLKSGKSLGRVMVQCNSKNELIIVDGQQRATTLMLLLASLQKRGSAEVSDILFFKGTPTLQPTYHDKEPFNAVIENKNAVGESHIVQASLWFDSWTSVLTKQDANKMTQNLLDHFTVLEFMIPLIEEAENLQVVYERLAIKSAYGIGRFLNNDRPGINNGVLDLSRNLVLSYFEETKAISLYHSHWMPLEIMVAENDTVYSQETENRFILHLKDFLKKKNWETSTNADMQSLEVYSSLKRFMESENCYDNRDKVISIVQELLNFQRTEDVFKRPL